MEVVQGIRGFGKTNYTKQLIKDITPLFIIDIRNEYKEYKTFHSLNEFMVYLFKRSYIINNLNSDKEQWRFVFSKQSELNGLFSLMQHFKDCTIIVDEADALCSVRKFCDGLVNMTLGARNNRVNLMFIAKRPFLIPIFIRSQADTFTVFRVEEKRDIQYLETRIRTSFPKNPFDLQKGEAIICKQGEKPELKKFPLYKENA